MDSGFRSWVPRESMFAISRDGLVFSGEPPSRFPSLPGLSYNRLVQFDFGALKNQSLLHDGSETGRSAH